jgi:hypothetical protein
MNITSITRPASPPSSFPHHPFQPFPFLFKKMYERSEFIYFAEQKKSCPLTKGGG